MQIGYRMATEESKRPLFQRAFWRQRANRDAVRAVLRYVAMELGRKVLQVSLALCKLTSMESISWSLDVNFSMSSIQKE